MNQKVLQMVYPRTVFICESQTAWFLVLTLSIFSMTFFNKLALDAELERANLQGDEEIIFNKQVF